MIRDDYIEPIRARPMQWLVRAYPTIDADDQFVPFARGFLQRRLLNAIAFSKAMRHVITGGRINIVIAVNQDRISIIDGPEKTPYRVGHPTHQKRIVKLIEAGF